MNVMKRGKEGVKRKEGSGTGKTNGTKESNKEELMEAKNERNKGKNLDKREGRNWKKGRKQMEQMRGVKRKRKERN